MATATKVKDVSGSQRVGARQPCKPVVNVLRGGDCPERAHPRVPGARVGPGEVGIDADLVDGARLVLEVLALGDAGRVAGAVARKVLALLPRLNPQACACAIAFSVPPDTCPISSWHHGIVMHAA